MELSLHGSQINLATRYKPTAPCVNYPNPPHQQHQRPGSASVTRLQQQQNNKSINLKRRPLSADCKVFETFKNQLRLTPEEEIRKKIPKVKRPSSSSNILKLLLSENINRSWTPQESDLKSESETSSLGAKIESRASGENQPMGSDGISDEESSVEEDIPDSANDDDDGDNELNVKINNLTLTSDKSPTTNVRNKLSKNLKEKEKLSQTKQVSFKAAWSHPQQNNSVEKTDLPGRVSFSSNDVFELDYSDYDNEDSDSNSSNEIKNIGMKKFVHFYDDHIEQKGNSQISIQRKEEERKIEVTDDKGIPSNMSAFHQTIKPDYSTSSKIIEDYKKEIESINRRHELELRMADSLSTPSSQQNNINLPNYFNNDFRLQNVTLEEFRNDINNGGQLEKPKEISSNTGDVIDDYFQTIDSKGDEKVTESGSLSLPISPRQPPIQKSLEITETSKWNNYGNFYTTTSITNSVKFDNTRDVINNYLKATEEEPQSTTVDVISTAPTTQPPKKQNNIVKKFKTIRENRKSKSATNNTSTSKITKSATPSATPKSTGKITLKKSKSIPNLKEDHGLGIFQIDKVESWMSIHDDNFTEKKQPPLRCDSTGTPSSAATLDYSKDWRDTPSSKTDDEGNFSLEDQGDNYSNESTYDEIVSIIKEIDADKRKSEEYKSLKSDVEFKLNTMLSSDTAESATSEETEGNDKMKEILTYLDNVNSNCDKTLQKAQMFIPDSDRSELEFAVEPDIVENVPKISDLLILPNHQLARRIVSLSLRANELSNAIQLSREHMAHVRQERIKAIRLEKQNSSNRLKEQKKHFEGIVVRHQGFIEQLLKDKSSLCEKVTALTRRMESQNQAWEHKLETEVAKTKETMIAGEKIRRERWVRENTKKIKELTVKGVEAEINKMAITHQQEMSDLRRQHQQELLDAVEEARQKHDIVEKAIRESYAEDREIVIEKERNAIRERCDRQISLEQKSFEEQKSRLISEFAAERERLHGEIKDKELEFETRREQLINERTDMLDQMRQDQKEKLHLIEEKHQSELISLRDQFERDFSIWKREHESTVKLREVERENAIRQQCRQDRDRQIDSIVTKIDAESLKTQQEFESKINRIKEKYENEIKELENAENNSREKYLETRHKLAETEGMIQNLQATMKQLEIELSHSKKMCDEFINEKESMKENARKEIKQELKTMQKERDSEIQRIYARVQQTIEKKDTALELLQKENTSIKERCLKLEAIIRQQRKDYCTK